MKQSIKSFDDLNIVYEQHGSSPNCIVLIHGLGINRFVWNYQVNLLKNSFSVVVIDLAGHGESGFNRKNYTIENYASDVAAVIESLGFTTVVLVGHSLGGAIALETEQLIPSKVHSIIGVDTLVYPFYTQKNDSEEIEQFLVPWRKNYKQELEVFTRSCFDPNASSELVDKTIEQVLSTKSSVFISSLTNLLSWDGDSALAKCNCPIDGMFSSLINADVDYAKLHKDKLSSIFYADCGHFLTLEKPQETHDLLASLLK